MSFNKVVLVGNLTRDPQVKYISSGTAVAETGLAINRTWYDKDKNKKEEVTFVDVKFWGRQAEIAGEYLSKGSQILVEGRLTQESWESDGQKRSKIVVTCENMQMLGSKSSEPKKGKAPKAEQQEESYGDDEVPF